MSTQYPVLDNRPINKWKVTELREELKRRSLPIKGLKDDLVRRLDDALREEWEAVQMEKSKGFDCESEPVLKSYDQADPDSIQMVDDDARKHSVIEVSEADDAVAKVETKDFSTDTEPAKAIGEVATGGDSDQFTEVGERKDSDAPLEAITSVDVNEGLPIEIAATEMVPENKVGEDEVMKSSQNDVVSIEGPSLLEVSLDNSGVVPEDSETKTNSAEETCVPNFMGEDNGVKVLPDASGEIVTSNKIDSENEVLKPLKMDAEPDELSNPSTQVHEVIPNLGSQVKSDSIPSDTLPIYVTKELNDDLNADNVQLEQELVVRPETVPPSSNKDPSDVGVSHPMDDKMPSESHGLVGGTDDDKSSNVVNFSMKNKNADQSLGRDVSIIEHNMDNKASNSTELLEVLSKDGNMDEAEFSSKGSSEEKLNVAASTEETNFQDGESADAGFSKITDTDMADGENLEKINLDQSSPDDSMEEDIVETKNVDSEQISSEMGEKTEEPRTYNATQSVIPSDAVEVSHGDKNNILDAPEKRKFQEAVAPESKEPAKRQRKWNSDSVKTSEPKNSSISLRISGPTIGGSDSTHDVDTPKECVVPESSRTPTNSLRIDNFVRPFTLKAVQELLGRTGKVCSFWMDNIKTHCYVMFSSVEEAIETRNAVYNLQWPTNGGRLLIADFVDPEDAKSRVEGGPPSTNPTTAPVSASPRVQTAPQVGPPPPSGERPHPLSRQPPMKERLARAPLPVADIAEAGPMLTLDDLFRKTRTTPRIYYLPLTEEQVSAKLSEQQRNK